MGPTVTTDREVNWLKFEEPDYIIDNIFLGSERSSCDLAYLQKNKIDRVVVAAYQCEMFFAGKHIDYLKLDIEDKSHQSLVEYFDEVIAFIRKDKKTNVLVHCRSGMSRSASLVIAYMMKTKGVTC